MTLPAQYYVDHLATKFANHLATNKPILDEELQDALVVLINFKAHATEKLYTIIRNVGARWPERLRELLVDAMFAGSIVYYDAHCWDLLSDLDREGDENNPFEESEDRPREQVLFTLMSVRFDLRIQSDTESLLQNSLYLRQNVEMFRDGVLAPEAHRLLSQVTTVCETRLAHLCEIYDANSDQTDSWFRDLERLVDYGREEQWNVLARAEAILVDPKAWEMDDIEDDWESSVPEATMTIEVAELEVVAPCWEMSTPQTLTNPTEIQVILLVGHLHLSSYPRPRLLNLRYTAVPTTFILPLKVIYAYLSRAKGKGLVAS